MPVRGLILLLVLAVIFAVIYKDRVYEWLTSSVLDDDQKDEDSKEEKK